jgi:hypothetical protein
LDEVPTIMTFLDLMLPEVVVKIETHQHSNFYHVEVLYYPPVMMSTCSSSKIHLFRAVRTT